MDLSKGWQIRQLDSNNAFINSDLKEEIFLEQPLVLKTFKLLTYYASSKKPSMV